MSSNESDNDNEHFEDCQIHGPWLRSVYNQEQQEWNAVLPIGCPACRRDAQLRTLLKRTAIPPRFANSNFDNFTVESPQQQTALDACRDYANKFEQMHSKGVCMVLRGNVGTGKNHLACAIARQVSAHGYSSLLLTVAEAIQRIRATWGDRDRQSPESHTEIIERFSDVNLLILDEVGRQYGSESEKINLFEVIDARYRALRPTIIISNLPPAEISTYLGAAAYDRLRENDGILVNFDWESHRGRR